MECRPSHPMITSACCEGRDSPVTELSTQTIGDGGEQDFLQLAAMDRVLRMLVACIAAERLAIDKLPKAIEEDSLAGQDRHARERIVEA